MTNIAMGLLPTSLPLWIERVVAAGEIIFKDSVHIGTAMAIGTPQVLRGTHLASVATLSFEQLDRQAEQRDASALASSLHSHRRLMFRMQENLL